MRFLIIEKTRVHWCRHDETHLYPFITEIEDDEINRSGEIMKSIFSGKRVFIDGVTVEAVDRLSHLCACLEGIDPRKTDCSQLPRFLGEYPTGLPWEVFSWNETHALVWHGYSGWDIVRRDEFGVCPHAMFEAIVTAFGQRVAVTFREFQLPGQATRVYVAMFNKQEVMIAAHPGRIVYHRDCTGDTSDEHLRSLAVAAFGGRSRVELGDEPPVLV